MMSVMRTWRSNWWLWAGLAILLVYLMMAAAPELLAPHDPEARFWPAWDDQGAMLTRPLPPGAVSLLLGSDDLGRDLISRAIWGTRVSLGLAVGITTFRMLVAVPTGLWAGWSQGFVARMTGVLSSAGSAIPVLLLLVLLLRPLRGMALTGAGFTLWMALFCTMVALGGLPRLAESVRRRVVAAAGAPYLESAVAAGATRNWILRRHILPHLLPELAVMAAAEVAWVLLLMGQLGIAGVFLGGGRPDPFSGRFTDMAPEWAQMLAMSRGAILTAPWVLLVPGVALALAAMGFHMTAEGLRSHWQRL